jgi:hypothetical protein
MGRRHMRTIQPPGFCTPHLLAGGAGRAGRQGVERAGRQGAERAGRRQEARAGRQGALKAVGRSHDTEDGDSPADRAADEPASPCCACSGTRPG